MCLNTNEVFISKITLKKFALQNLSFVSTSKINFLNKTVLSQNNSLKNNILSSYLNLMFCYLQFFYTTKINIIQNYSSKDDFFILRNVKVFNSNFDNSIRFYLCGVDNSTFASKSYGFFNKFLKHLSKYTEVFFSSWVSNIFFLGVGYKVFIFNNYLYLRLGFSRMLKILIPTTVTVMTRKRNHLRIMSSKHEQLESFLYLLKNLRVFDCYKGKGIFQTSDFSTIKLKVGKKQQFF